MKQSFPGYIFVHLPGNSAEDRLLDLSISTYLKLQQEAARGLELGGGSPHQKGFYHSIGKLKG